MAVCIALGYTALFLAWPLTFFVMVKRKARADRLSLVRAWAEGQAMTLDERRICFLVPDVESTASTRLICRVHVRDRSGATRNGWATIHGRLAGLIEFIPRTVESRMGRGARSLERAKPSLAVDPASLRDEWVDG